MSSETETQTSSTQTNDPPDWAAPLFKTAAFDALNLYNSGQGGGTYPGQGVVNMGRSRKRGLNQLAKAGRSWDDLSPGFIQDYVGTADLLNPIASGDYLKEGNPYYKERLTNDINDTMDLLKAQTSGVGRYGSDWAAGEMANTAGDMMLQGLENDWNRERGYQQDAIYGLGDIYSNANSMASQLFQDSMTGARAQLAAGTMKDQYRQSKLDDDMRRWYGNENEDWQRIAMLLGAATGSAGPYGTMTGQSNSSSSTSDPMSALSAVGGLMPPK